MLKCRLNRCEDGACGTSGFNMIRKSGFIGELIEVIAEAEESDNVVSHQV